MKQSKIIEKMSTINPGDKIDFNSYGACYNPGQLGRSGGSTVPATGTVIKVYPRYVLVRLKVARECVHWGSICKVNGIDWPLYNEAMA